MTIEKSCYLPNICENLVLRFPKITVLTDPHEVARVPVNNIKYTCTYIKTLN